MEALHVLAVLANRLDAEKARLGGRSRFCRAGAPDPV
jgi:hypothetical protein